MVETVLEIAVDVAQAAVGAGAQLTNVRQAEELLEEETAFLARAGMAEFGQVEAWTFAGSNHALAYSTHGAFRYFGKFPPPVARRLIEEYTVPGDQVVDLMAGSGTTGVECLLMGRRALLNDVNPLSELIARVKTTRLTQGDGELALERVMTLAAIVTAGNFSPVGLRDYEHWFLPATIDSLRRLRRAIKEETPGPVQDYLWVCFASIVRRVSRATTQQGRLFLDVVTAQGDALPHFEKAARTLLRMVEDLPVGEISVTCEDVRQMCPSGVTPLVILHPPYFNAYKYTSVNSLEMSWLGLPIKDTRPREIREFFKVGKPENVSAYIHDMTEVMRSAATWLAPGGVMGMMIGDTAMKGEHIRVTRPLLDETANFFDVEKVILRVPKYTEASWAASQRRTAGNLGAKMFDYVIVLRKK